MATNGIDLSKVKRADKTFRHCEVVPEWGGAIYLRLLTAAERVSLSCINEAGEFFVELLCRCICDEHGNPAPDVVQAIREAGAEHVDLVSRLASLAAKMNGLLKQAKDDVKKKSA